ncbi:hypothetical protein SLS53_008455 [Cytospora paraplurivora]|uniref:Uncharacterized protein n=1 Tax=Cytospora paraplurivora TaxID=2898453 RepID=A0AAN9YCP5_9PEZI
MAMESNDRSLVYLAFRTIALRVGLDFNIHYYQGTMRNLLKKAIVLPGQAPVPINEEETGDVDSAQPFAVGTIEKLQMTDPSLLVKSVMAGEVLVHILGNPFSTNLIKAGPSILCALEFSIATKRVNLRAGIFLKITALLCGKG